MFNIGMTELILLLLIAFIVVGPKDLPKVARALGRLVRYIRGIVKEIKEETGFDDLTGELKDVQREIQQTVKDVDPRADLKQAEHEINQGLREVKEAVDVKGIEKDINHDLGGKSL